MLIILHAVLSFKVRERLALNFPSPSIWEGVRVGGAWDTAEADSAIVDDETASSWRSGEDALGHWTFSVAIHAPARHGIPCSFIIMLLKIRVSRTRVLLFFFCPCFILLLHLHFKKFPQGTHTHLYLKVTHSHRFLLSLKILSASMIYPWWNCSAV